MAESHVGPSGSVHTGSPSGEPAADDPSVDPRALAALAALRAGAGAGAEAPRGASAGGAPELLVAEPGWSPVVHRLRAWWSLLATRWGPGPAGAAVVAAVALVGAAVWFVAAGWAGVGGGGPAAVSLPFTTTTDGSSAATGSGTGGGSGASGAAPSTVASALVVHAAGAVAAPGVHRVPAGARVADVLAAAGGATADADLDRVNLAAPVSDGQRLYVPRLGEQQLPVPVAPGGAAGDRDGAAGSTGPSAPPAPVDLNAAGVAELDTLPGVGPSTAAAIVEHRERNGPFASVDDLLDVRGIGPAKLDALRDLVVVG